MSKIGLGWFIIDSNFKVRGYKPRVPGG